jgi:hypothetical protein
MARGWPFKTFGSGIHCFLMLNHNIWGLPIKNPDAENYYFEATITNDLAKYDDIIGPTSRNRHSTFSEP